MVRIVSDRLGGESDDRGKKMEEMKIIVCGDPDAVYIGAY